VEFTDQMIAEKIGHTPTVVDHLDKEHGTIQKYMLTRKILMEFML